MGIFTRFKDIVNSNINAMLDDAEEPEKMIKLMIREMEDTLVEIKSACAGVMASRKRVQREIEEVGDRTRFWQEKATLAVDKGRDDLAREALKEKRRYVEKTASLEKERIEHDALVSQYQADIQQLEDKLAGAREKQRVLVQRAIRARNRKTAQEEIRRMDGADAIIKFDEMESRIERMEAEADLVNMPSKTSLVEELNALGEDDDIEMELNALKNR